MIGFYKSLGAVPMEEWTKYRVTGAALEKLAIDTAAKQTIGSDPAV